MNNSYTINANGFTSGEFESTLSPTGDTSSSKRSNALSNKLTNVLSSSYADSETRDALRLLDARGAHNAENTKSNLKHDAQQAVIEVNAKIVDDFGLVAHQLKRVGALITVLNRTCDDMRNHIQLAKQETAPMLEEASTLLARKNETESKQHLLTAFNEHFLISDEDLTTLTSSAEPVNDQYFTVLAHVKQVHKDCEILLGYENQRLGLELMEQTTRNLDAGYKKLYNWIQREFKGLDLEDPHISGSIRRSLRALSERPTLFQNCLDFFGEARQVTLSEAFQKALTDSTLGSSKAIEFSTHDPLRYIGDMLAWVHSTTVSEKEALEGLFVSDADEIARGLRAGKSSEPWARLRRSQSATANGAGTSDDDDEDDDAIATETAFNGHAALNSLISRNMASVAQVLNQRISLTVRNLSDQITTYKVYNLLLFYRDIFEKLLGITSPSASGSEDSASQNNNSNNNTLLVAMSTLQSQALKHFQTTVSENIEAHSTSIEPTPTLQPPGLLQSNLTLFSTVLHLRAPNLGTAEFAQLYATLLAPVLELCGESALSLGPENDEQDEDEDDDKQSFEALIYRLNYMHPIVSTLRTLAKDTTLGAFVAAPMRSAEQEIDRLTDELSEHVEGKFLVDSGMRELYGRVRTLNGKYEESRVQALSERLEDDSAKLDTFLASALMDVQDDLSKLTDKSVALTVAANAVEEFCERFEKTVGLLDDLDLEWEGHREQAGKDVDGEGADEEPLLRDLYPRTVAEVRALLS